MNQTIDNIAIKIRRNRDFFKHAHIYKSLGPKDITVLVESVDSLESIFRLLEEINQQKNPLSEENKKGGVLRTFTMLCSNFGKEPLVEKGFSLISYLRISNKFKEEDIQQLVNKKEMFRVTAITGVMDYRVVWKSDISISNVLVFYNEMTSKGYLTDFQTKIEKIIYKG